jgi:dTDP-4-dehydrorhamnose reductase
MRVAIIGTSGQLATELRRRPWSHGLEALDAEKVDIADADAITALLDRQAPELVVNASAYTAVDRAETERERAFAVNEAGPRHLATWCERHGASLIHVSTDYVFNGQKAEAYVEQDATEPLGVYGASKLAGEEAIRGSLARHVVLRTSWVFSAHGQNFLKTVLRLARERDELRIVSDQRGRPTAAADLADAVLHVARKVRENSAVWGTFHFAGAGATSWHGFASAIVTEQAPFTQREPSLIAIGTADYPTPAKRPANSVLDTSHFETSFGLTPRSWRDGLREAVAELTGPSLRAPSV